MRKRLALRLFMVGLFSVIGLVLVSGSAHASAPADLTVGMAYRPYGGNQVPLTNVGVTASVVSKTTSNGIGIPINSSPYFGRHLAPAGGNPTTNSIVFQTDQGTSPSIFGGSFAYRNWNNLIWCGNSVGVPDQQFQLDVSLNVGIFTNYLNYNGEIITGKWVGYWHFEGVGVNDVNTFFDGTSARVPALNPYRTFVVFEFQQDAPRITFQGYKVNEQNNGDGPYRDAQVLINNSGAFTTDSNGAANASAQPYFIRGIVANADHVIRPTAIPGYEVVGWKNGPDGAITGGSQYNYTANSLGNNATVNLWWVYRPIINQTSTVTCGAISGTVTGPAGLATNISIGGQSLGANQGASFNYSVPEELRDGVSRPVVLTVTYPGGSRTFALANHLCSPNATCDVNNLADIFPANRATLNVGDQESGISVRMRNAGATPPAQAIWGANASSGSYRLVLTAAADVFWDLGEVAIPGGTKIYPEPGAAGQTTFYQFSGFTLTLSAAPQGASTPLGFQMAFVASDGTVTRFGSACSTNLRVLSAYGPWLRSQNGNIAALGKIVGQPAFTGTGTGLGGRNATGTNNDLNLEATYLVMSAASTGTNGPFCSTNAYLLGRGDDINSCSFGQYTFRLGGSLASALSATDSSEVIYRDLEDGVGQAGSCIAFENDGSKRYVNGGNYNGGGFSPFLNAGCPTIYQLSGDTLGPASNPPGLSSLNAKPIPPGRTTLLVNGPLRINANLINQTPGNFPYDVDDMRKFNGLPNLGIVVKGDIIIDGDVERIDASLYATGTIKSCDKYSDGATAGQKNEKTPLGANDDGVRCSKQLSIRGLAAAKQGFEFGRNYVSFGDIAGRVGAGQYAANFEYNANRGLYFGKPAEDVIYNGALLFAPPPGFEYLTSPDLSGASYTSDSAQPRF